MKKSLATSLVFVLLMVRIGLSQETAAERPKDASSDKAQTVMQHWEGDWTGGVAGAADTAVPHIGATPDHAEVKWTLDHNFLLGKNLDKDNKAVGVWLMRYNPKTDKYQVWFFTSQGDASVWNGAWNEDRQTMTWDTRDTESGVAGKGHTTFANNRQLWTMEVTKDGKTDKSNGSLTRK